MEKSAIKAVLCAVFAVVAGTGHNEVTIFNLNFEVGVNFLGEGAFGTLYGYYIFLVDGDVDTCRDLNGSFTYT